MSYLHDFGETLLQKDANEKLDQYKTLHRRTEINHITDMLVAKETQKKVILVNQLKSIYSLQLKKIFLNFLM